VISGIQAAAMRAFKETRIDGGAFMTLPVIGG
jgi:hypothetical protein